MTKHSGCGRLKQKCSLMLGTDFKFSIPLRICVVEGLL